jgi:hypothetical protein
MSLPTTVAPFEFINFSYHMQRKEVKFIFSYPPDGYKDAIQVFSHLSIVSARITKTTS